MTKQEFLRELENGLSGLPKAEINEYIGFYSEMIDDYIEDGFSEQDAVAAAGSLEKIAEDIIADTPITKLVKEKIKPKKKLGAWAITLIVLGSPIWLALLIAAFAIVLAFYIALWAVVIALWAAFVSVLASGFGGVAGGVFLICSKSGLSGLFLIGAGLVCIGISILLFFLCKLATKGVILLLNQLVRLIKNKIAKRGDCNE
jgi:uncharacterized membrane protein